ncbi:hypothetical protein PF004_g9306 [Phytophthora fragariae]|uniref:Uncharacterized protein n=1 Tax=Phytophthora fragariae TaxID=53985 RepID=A0A6G0P4K5_9STRA|nr:hypothetical protein PF004_g9306 [Phytophthora fragariae]
MTVTDDTVKAVLEDRPSRLSDLKPTQSESAYSNLASPSKPIDTELENGALREGNRLTCGPGSVSGYWLSTLASAS